MKRLKNEKIDGKTYQVFKDGNRYFFGSNNLRRRIMLRAKNKKEALKKLRSKVTSKEKYRIGINIHLCRVESSKTIDNQGDYHLTTTIEDYNGDEVAVIEDNTLKDLESGEKHKIENVGKVVDKIVKDCVDKAWDYTTEMEEVEEVYDWLEKHNIEHDNGEESSNNQTKHNSAYGVNIKTYTGTFVFIVFMNKKEVKKFKKAFPSVNINKAF